MSDTRPDKLPSISVVIPTFNRRDSLRRTLESLFAQNYEGDFEIVVIVDGSTDGTVEMLASLQAPCPLRWFAQPNQGTSVGCNRGVREAKNELIVFVDDDNVAVPELLREHALSHAGHDNRVVLGAVLLASDDETFSPLPMGHEGYDEYYRRVFEGKLRLPQDASIAQNTSLRRAHYLAVGGLDETFKFMHEDDELGYRLYKQGFDFATNPRAIVYHRLAKKAKQVLSDEAFLNGHNSVLLYRKHPEFRAGYNLGSTFFSGSAPKRWAKQRLLAWPWLAGVWRGVALALHHCGKAAGAASLCAQQIYFLQYCRGVRAAGGTLRELRDAFDRHTPILFYHSVCDTTEPSLRYMSVNPRAFAAQMRWLKARGYEAITLDQWFDWLDCAKPLPRKPVIITFDDGFRDNLQNALPILRRHDFTATIFLVSEGIGKTSFWDKSHGVAELPMLSADEVRQMTREGVSFQSHGLTQASLPSLSPAQQEVELVGSKKQLESLLGASVNYFAYPQGEFTPECAECVKAAGYRGAFSTRAGFTNLDDDRFAIRRLAVTGRDNWLTFSLMLWRGRNVAADAWRKVSSPRGEGSE